MHSLRILNSNSVLRYWLVQFLNISNMNSSLSKWCNASDIADHLPEFGAQTVTAGKGTDSMFLKLTKNNKIRYVNILL